MSLYWPQEDASDCGGGCSLSPSLWAMLTLQLLLLWLLTGTRTCLSWPEHIYRLETTTTYWTAYYTDHNLTTLLTLLTNADANSTVKLTRLINSLPNTALSDQPEKATQSDTRLTRDVYTLIFLTLEHRTTLWPQKWFMLNV